MAIISQPINATQRMRLPRHGTDPNAWITDAQREMELWTQNGQELWQNHYTDLATLDAAITAAQGDLAALEARVDQAEIDIDALELAVVDLDTRVDLLETAVTALVADVAALEAVLTPRSCMARRTTAQTIADSTVTTVSLTGADLFDTAAMHDPGSNPSRVLAPTSGSYLITGSVLWDSNTTGERLAEIRINGGSVIASQRHQAGGNDANCVSVVMRSFSYAELRVAQSSSGNLDLLSAELCVSAIPEFP